MEFTGGGTAVLIAIAAGLWLFYLVPVWRRRTEYLSTERNAVRLQQTLRIMAQTAEIPEAVRAEMTAREIANQERTLAARQREEQAIARVREAAAQRAVRERLAITAPGLAAEVDAAQRGQARVRRSRAFTSLVTLLAVIGSITAIVVGAWAWATFAAFVVVSGVGLLVGLARATRRRMSGVVTPARSSRFFDFAAETTGRAERDDAVRAWTPVPLPKPRYLGAFAAFDIGSQRPGLAAIDHTAVLAAAVAESEVAQRTAMATTSPHESAAASVSPTPERTTAEAPAGVSRFARMGVIDDLSSAAPNLDEVLERRRAAG
jgi:hypothetical protein